MGVASLPLTPFKGSDSGGETLSHGGGKGKKRKKSKGERQAVRQVKRATKAVRKSGRSTVILASDNLLLH